MILEEMICQSNKGLLCKICESDRFGVLFRYSHKESRTIKSKYGCRKCIISLLEKEIGNNSDKNKIIQDMINYLKE